MANAHAQVRVLRLVRLAVATIQKRHRCGDARCIAFRVRCHMDQRIERRIRVLPRKGLQRLLCVRCGLVPAAVLSAGTSTLAAVPHVD